MTIQKLKCGVGNTDGGQLVSTVNDSISRLEKKSLHSPTINAYTGSNFSAVDGGGAILENIIAPNGLPALKITTPVFSTVNITAFVGRKFKGSAFVTYYGSKSLTNLGSVDIRIHQETGTRFWQLNRSAIDAPLNESTEQGGTVHVHAGAHNMTTTGAPDSEFAITRFDIRTSPAVGGSPAVMYLFGVSIDAPARKSRLCVVYDDGWRSSLDLGVTQWNAAGLKTTLAIIPDLIDQKLPNYVDMPMLRSYISAGHAVVPHGPYDGGSSLTDLYDNAQDAVEDIQSVIDWIRENGLSTPGFESCYIWPMGRFQWTPNDTSLLDAASEIGITTARIAQQLYSDKENGNIDAQCKYGRLTRPHIGHNFPGTTAGEVGNIAAIIARMQEYASVGGIDFYLMLHKVVVDSTPDGSMSISIRESDHQQLVDAAKALVDAGTLDVVTMTDLAIDDNASNEWASY